jgi:hypothetical protein
LSFVLCHLSVVSGPLPVVIELKCSSTEILS